MYSIDLPNLLFYSWICTQSVISTVKLHFFIKLITLNVNELDISHEINENNDYIFEVPGVKPRALYILTRALAMSHIHSPGN